MNYEVEDIPYSFIRQFIGLTVKVYVNPDHYPGQLYLEGEILEFPSDDNKGHLILANDNMISLIKTYEMICIEGEFSKPIQEK